MTASRIVLVTGGGRSGKSSYAQRLGEALPGPRVYVATAVAFDEELKERVARHQEDRLAGGWSATVEEPVDLARGVRQAPAGPTLLVDCLTMWMGNLMWEAEQIGLTLSEADVAAFATEVAAAARERGGTVVFVTNEVGLGIIPDNPASRLYRDLLGRCNQIMAAEADTVVLMVSGLPLVLKGPDPFATPSPDGSEVAPAPPAAPPKDGRPS